MSSGSFAASALITLPEATVWTSLWDQLEMLAKPTPSLWEVFQRDAFQVPHLYQDWIVCIPRISHSMLLQIFVRGQSLHGRIPAHHRGSGSAAPKASRDFSWRHSILHRQAARRVPWMFPGDSACRSQSCCGHKLMMGVDPFSNLNRAINRLDIIAVIHFLNMPAYASKRAARSSVKAKFVDPSIEMWLSS